MFPCAFVHLLSKASKIKNKIKYKWMINKQITHHLINSTNDLITLFLFIFASFQWRQPFYKLTHTLYYAISMARISNLLLKTKRNRQNTEQTLCLAYNIHKNKINFLTKTSLFFCCYFVFVFWLIYSSHRWIYLYFMQQ